MSKLLSLLTGALGGIWGYVALAAFVSASSVWATHHLDATAYGLQISNLKLSQQQQATANVSQSLATLQGFIGKMQNADTNYNGTLQTILDQFAGIKGQLANVQKQTPLPLDCKPDAGRLRVLSTAVAAANSKASASAP